MKQLYRGKRRRAVVMIAALVCLVVVGVMSRMLVQAVVAHGRQSSVLARNIQCMCLLHSGVERALARLARDPQYAGERWAVSAESLKSPWSGLTIIAVERDAVDSSLRHIQVTAQYPVAMPSRIVHRRRITYRIAAPSTAQP